MMKKYMYFTFFNLILIYSILVCFNTKSYAATSDFINYNNTLATAKVVFESGDINGDSKINLSDVLVLRRFIANSNKWNLTSEQQKKADVNGDSKINLSDVLVLRRYLAASSNSSIAKKHPTWLDLYKETAKEEYTVVFKDGDTTIKEVKVTEGETVTKPTNPTKLFYRFDCWKLNNVEYNFSSKVTGNITLQASWLDDYKNITNYANDSNTPINVGSNIKLYKCINNYKVAAQSFAITQNYLYFSGPTNNSWTNDGRRAENGDEYELNRISANRIYRINRETNQKEYADITYAGHAQSFDVASNFVELDDGTYIDQMFFNSAAHFSGLNNGITLDGKAGAYGANFRAFGYNKFTKDKDIIYPEKVIALGTDGKFGKILKRSDYTANGVVNTTSFINDIKKIGSNTSYLDNAEMAVDEANNRVAFLTGTSSGYRVYIHSLSELKAQNTNSLIKKFDIVASGKQGVEFYNGYLYLLCGGAATNTNTKVTLYKFNVTNAKNGATVASEKTLSFELYTEYTKQNLTGPEPEGLSIFGGKVFMGISSRNSDNKFCFDIYQIVGL